MNQRPCRSMAAHSGGYCVFESRISGIQRIHSFSVFFSDPFTSIHASYGLPSQHRPKMSGPSLINQAVVMTDCDDSVHEAFWQWRDPLLRFSHPQ